MSSLADEIETSVYDLDQQYPECLHIHVMKIILVEYDREHDIPAVFSGDHEYTKRPEASEDKEHGIAELSWDKTSFL